MDVLSLRRLTEILTVILSSKQRKSMYISFAGVCFAHRMFRLDDQPVANVCQVRNHVYLFRNLWTSRFTNIPLDAAGRWSDISWSALHGPRSWTSLPAVHSQLRPRCLSRILSYLSVKHHHQSFRLVP